MLHIPSPSPETPMFLCYSYYILLILLISTIQIVFIVVQSSHKLLHKVKISIFQIIQAIRQKQKGYIIMANIGVFDVLGPIMIGPSSSHTAGAARLGKIARTIVNKPIKEVTFLLHGSFKETYRGHGTDRALVAGILGMEPSDDRLRNAIELAEKEGIAITFQPSDLGQVHPNTVKFLITDCDGIEWEVLGSSIGGGLVAISEINGNKVKITGEFPTIITCHDDIPGTVSKTSTLFYENGINIAHMTLVRSQKGKDATMTLEVDSLISKEIEEKIKQIDGINRVIVINSLGGN